MRNYVACVFGLGAALAVTSARADGFMNTGAGPVADFSGLGLGLDFGAGIGGNGAVDTSGIIGGGHVGYMLQNGGIVGGLEADATLGNLGGSQSGYGNFQQDWLNSARIKAGYAFGPILAYGTLGAAWSSTSLSYGGYTSDKLVHGYVFGVGAEYALTRTWSLRAELRRYNFDGATYYVPSGATNASTENNMLLIGGTMHF
jgi:opacity protein-like surface antigen